MTLIAAVPGDAIDRAIWSLDYLGRTVFYNGYWRGFQPKRAAKRTLKEPGVFGHRGDIKRALAAGASPVNGRLIFPGRDRLKFPTVVVAQTSA